MISCYHDLWHVEQSFRMSKTDLAARPMFVRTKDAIEAHLTIVFTALAVARTVQHRSGLAVRNVIRQLRPLRSATIAINGATQTFPPAIDPDKQELLDTLVTEIQGTNEKPNSGPVPAMPGDAPPVHPATRYQRRHILARLQPWLCPGETRPQQPQQLIPFPQRQPGAYPDGSGRL